MNFLLGGFAAALLDASLLAWKVHPAATVAPTVTLMRGGAVVGVEVVARAPQ